MHTAPPATMPAAAFAVFSTIASGNWSNNAIWAGGVAPGSTITADDTVNINAGHVVTYNLGSDLEIFGTLNINGGTFQTPQSGTGSGRSVFVRSGGKLNVTNGNFILPIFNSGGGNLSGNFVNQNGMVTVTNSRVEIAQNFQDTSNDNGGMRTFTGGCLRVGQNFSNEGSVDLYDGTCIEIGLQGSGSFTNKYQMTFQNSVILKLVGSGNFENTEGPGIFGGAGSPDISNLGISNGNLVNDRPWSAQVLNFCVSGNVQGSMVGDFNNDVTNNDTAAACTAVSAANCNACSAGPPNPILTKSFSPTTFVSGGFTTLTFTITNTGSGAVAQSGLAFTDTLPNSLRVANPPNIVGMCGGTVTAAAGSSTISLSGGSLAAGATCTFSVNVTNVPGELNNSCDGNPGAFTNRANRISGLSANLTNGVQPSCVTVTASRPTLTKSFSPTTFVNGGTTTLTFTINNTQTDSVARMNLSFTDTLPSGLRVANPNGISGTCGAGTVTAVAGGTTISLSGGTIAAGATCSFSVNVTNVADQLNSSCMGNPAAFTNSATNITAISNNLNNGVTPSCVIVTAPSPVLTKSFSPNTFVNGGTTTLTFTITNTGTGAVAQSGLGFTDTLPSNLIVAATPNVSNTCGGTVTAAAGGTTIMLANGAVGANTICTFSVAVTNVPGQLNGSCTNNPAAFTNSATNISNLVGNLTNGVQPSCVTVTGPNPTLTKSFSPTTFVNGGTTTLTFTITNTETGATNQTGLGFTDTLPSGLIVANPANIVGTCGGTVTATAGSSTISLSGGGVTAGGTCTFSVAVTNVAGQLNASCNSNPAAFTNTAGNISGLSSGLNNGVTPSCVTVTAPLPVLTKSFFPTTFVNGGTTTLTFTIDNTATGAVAQTGLAFIDTLPGGLRVANPSNAATTCGAGTVTATAGGSAISLSGGSVAAGASCTVTVSVTNQQDALNSTCNGNPQLFTNSFTNISGLSSNLTNAVAPSCVTVTSPLPVLTKSFMPTTFVSGGFTTLTFTITNTAPGSSPRSGLSFTDSLPGGLQVAATPNIVGMCGGTVTAAAGGTTISLSGGSLAAGASCSFSVNVTNMPGMLNPSCMNPAPLFTNTAANITSISMNLTNGVGPSCVTVTAPPTPNPVLTKSFSPTTFVNGGTTALTFTITNTGTDSAAQSNLAFTDTLPSGLIVASPAGSSTTCGAGTVMATAGGNTISLSGGSVAAGGSCTVTVNVTNVTDQLNSACPNAPNFTNSSTNISGLSSNLNNGVQPSCVNVTAPDPVLTKSFSPTTFVNGGTTTLTFTITNTGASTVARSGLAFTDTLPSGLIVATPANVVTTCGGTVTATPGSSTITLANGTVGDNTSCTISVQVTNVAGQLNATCPNANFTNSSTSISGLTGLSNGVQPSCVTVTAPNPTLTKSFIPTSFVSGERTTLLFTITNTGTGAAAQSNLSFTDTLPSGLIVATPNGIAGTCGAGTVTATAGGTTISLSGGSVAAGGSCSFSVQVTNAAGQTNASCDGNPPAFTNSAGNITAISTNLNNGVQPSCVTVTAPPPNPTLTKSFSPTTFVDGGTTTLTFTITNTATGAVAQSGLAFTDTLPSGLRVAAPPNVVGACGGTVTAVAGSTTISLSGGSLAVGGTCTFSVQVTNVPGQFNTSCDGNPAAFTNSAANISGLSSTLINGVQPSCVTVMSTPPGTSPKGPGLPYPDDAEVSDQKAGSVLVYPIYTSNAASPNMQNARISITNVDPNRDVAVHLYFVDGATCSIADAVICLTRNQTASFLASDLDPGTTGYIVAVATDLVTGCPIKFNCLIGDLYVKFASGHQANLGAEAFSAIAATPAACDGSSLTAQLNFDGVSYNRVPRTVAASSIPARNDGNDTMLILNRFGGNLAVGADRLVDLFGLLYNDAENVVSFGFSPNTCQFVASLSSNFLRTTPRYDTFIQAGRSGWLRLYSSRDIGLLGAVLNYNPNTGTSAGAFNQGHNLHKLTLTSATLTIPIFPPNCRN